METRKNKWTIQLHHSSLKQVISGTTQRKISRLRQSTHMIICIEISYLLVFKKSHNDTRIFKFIEYKELILRYERYISGLVFGGTLAGPRAFAWGYCGLWARKEKNIGICFKRVIVALKFVDALETTTPSPSTAAEIIKWKHNHG